MGAGKNEEMVGGVRKNGRGGRVAAAAAAVAAAEAARSCQWTLNPNGNNQFFLKENKSENQ